MFNLRTTYVQLKLKPRHNVSSTDDLVCDLKLDKNSSRDLSSSSWTLVTLKIQKVTKESTFRCTPSPSRAGSSSSTSTAGPGAGGMNQWINESMYQWIFKWNNEWMTQWMKSWMNERMHDWMND